MNLFLDTEFNGFGGELISIALVDEKGRSFYASIGCNEPTEWVAENVMPKLPPKTSQAMARRNLELWLGAYPSIHIVADWPEDISHFCGLLITGAGMCMTTPPITMQIVRGLEIDSADAHCALADAQALRLACMAWVKS